MTTIWSNDDYGQEYTPKVKANEDYIPEPYDKHFEWKASMDQDDYVCKHCGQYMHYDYGPPRGNDALHTAPVDEIVKTVKAHLRDEHGITDFQLGADEVIDYDTLLLLQRMEQHGSKYGSNKRESDLDPKENKTIKNALMLGLIVDNNEGNFSTSGEHRYDLSLSPEGQRVLQDDHQGSPNLTKYNEHPMGTPVYGEVHGSSVNGYDAKEFKNFCLACAGRGFMFPTGMRCPNCKGTGIYDSEREYEDPKPSVSRASNDKPYSPLSDQEPKGASGNRLYEAVCEDCMGSGRKTVYSKSRVRAGDDGSFRGGHLRPEYKFPCKKCAGGGYVKKEDQPTNILDTEPEWRIMNKRHSDVKEARLEIRTSNMHMNEDNIVRAMAFGQCPICNETAVVAGFTFNSDDDWLGEDSPKQKFWIEHFAENHGGVDGAPRGYESKATEDLYQDVMYGKLSNYTHYFNELGSYNDSNNDIECDECGEVFDLNLVDEEDLIEHLAEHGISIGDEQDDDYSSKIRQLTKDIRGEGRPKDKRQTQIFNAPPENLARIGNLKQEGDPDWTTTPDPSGHTWNEFGQKEKTSRSNYTQYHDRPRAKAEQDANRGDIEHDSLEDPLSWYSSEDIMPLSELNEASTEIQDIYPTDPVGDDLRDNPNLSDYHYNMDASQMYDLYVDAMKKHLGDYTSSATPEKLQRAKELLDGWSQNTMIFDMPNSKRNSPEGIKEFTHAKHFVQMWLDSWIQTVSGTMPDPSWESKANEETDRRGDYGYKACSDCKGPVALDSWGEPDESCQACNSGGDPTNQSVEGQTVRQMTGHTGEASQSATATKYEFWKKYNTNGTMQEWINYAQNQGLEKEVAEIEWELNQESGDEAEASEARYKNIGGDNHKHEWVSGEPFEYEWCNKCGVSRDEVDEVKYGDKEKEHLDKMKAESEEDLEILPEHEEVSIDLKPKTEDDISQANKDHLLLEQFRG